MKTPPPTSLEAYKNMQPKIPTDQELILAVLSDEKAMTYNEIAKAVRLEIYKTRNTFNIEQHLSIFNKAQSWMNPNKASRRMLELIKLKKVITGEVRKCTIAKSNCKTYLLKKLNNF